MLQNAHLLGKIGADTTENEPTLPTSAKICHNAWGSPTRRPATGASCPQRGLREAPTATLERLRHGRRANFRLNGSRYACQTIFFWGMSVVGDTIHFSSCNKIVWRHSFMAFVENPKLARAGRAWAARVALQRRGSHLRSGATMPLRLDIKKKLSCRSDRVKSVDF